MALQTGDHGYKQVTKTGLPLSWLLSLMPFAKDEAEVGRNARSYWVTHNLRPKLHPSGTETFHPFQSYLPS